MKFIKADLHNHFSTKSRVLDANKVADTVHKSLGWGGLCALVNYDDARYEAFSRAAEKASPTSTNFGNAIYFPDRNVLIVRGQELPTEIGDLLVLGTPEGSKIPHRESWDYSIKSAQDFGGITIVPHPFLTSQVGDKISKEKNDEVRATYLKGIDAIETHNGGAFLGKSANSKAAQLYEEVARDFPNIGQLSSTDGHSFKEVGLCYTMLELPSYRRFSSAEEIRQALGKAVRDTKIYLHKENSYFGAAIHAGIILTSIAANKLHIPWNRGDKEALN